MRVAFQEFGLRISDLRIYFWISDFPISLVLWEATNHTILLAIRKSEIPK